LTLSCLKHTIKLGWSGKIGLLRRCGQAGTLFGFNKEKNFILNFRPEW